MLAKKIRIISGGQTGSDRGALMAALDRGIPCGGWCPADRQDERGVIPAIFPVRPLAGADPAKRTVRNALESDATCIVRFRELDEGSKLAAAACRRENKPYLYLDAHELEVEEAAQELRRFVREHQITTLNISGPRASGHPAAESWTRRVVRTFLMAWQDRRANLAITG